MMVTIWTPFQDKGRISRYGDSHHINMAVVRPSYLYNGNPHSLHFFVFFGTVIATGTYFAV